MWYTWLSIISEMPCHWDPAMPLYCGTYPASWCDSGLCSWQGEKSATPFAALWRWIDLVKHAVVELPCIISFHRTKCSYHPGIVSDSLIVSKSRCINHHLPAFQACWLHNGFLGRQQGIGVSCYLMLVFASSGIAIPFGYHRGSGIVSVSKTENDRDWAVQSWQPDITAFPWQAGYHRHSISRLHDWAYIWHRSSDQWIWLMTSRNINTSVKD